MTILKTYTIATINIKKIDAEIKSAGHVLNYAGLNYTNDQLEISGDSISDEASLDAIIANHDSVDTQKDIDFLKYKKRADVKDDILATMASNNMDRVRSGIWTVEQLVELTQDVELKSVLDDVSTLSYELAVGKVQSATNALLTAEIKNEWIAMLVSHFYN